MKPGMIGVLGSIALAATLAASAVHAACQLQQVAEYNITMDGNQPLVDATINGHPVRFLVDLGAWVTALSEPGARSLGLVPRTMSGTAVKMYGVGGEANAHDVLVHDFRLGALDQRDVNLFVVSNRRFSPLAVGIIGEEILSLGDVEFDFAHGKMRMFQPKDCNGDAVVYWANAYAMAPIWNPADHTAIKTEVRLDGHPFLAQLDTGAAVSVVTTKAATQVGVTAHSEGVSPARRSFGIGESPVETSVAVFPTFSIGVETIKNAKLQIADLFANDTYTTTGSMLSQKIEGFPDMLLGADFFMAHRVYIARSQGKIYFTYNGGPIFQTVAPPMSGEIDQFIQNEDQAIALNPNNDAAYAERAQAHLRKGETDLAIQDFDQLIRLKPNSGEAYNNRCWARASANQSLDLALADCNAALDRTASNPSERPGWLDSRGLVYFRMGDFDKSIADYDAALKGAPSEASSLFGRGLAKRRKGDTAGGDADIAAAKTINPDIAGTYARMGLTP